MTSTFTSSLTPSLHVDAPAYAAVPAGPAVPLFVSGEDGFNTFRIPALTRCKDGTLIAIVEGRASVGDQASNVLVMRRKVPGRDWSAPVTVVDDSPSALNDACLIASTFGTVFLAYQRYPAGFREGTVHPGYDIANSCHTFLRTSTDSGKTWSDAVDITRAVKLSTDRPCASGPGRGLELTKGPHRGRLIIPFNAGTGGGKYYDFCAYSDDKGKTWHRGQPVAAAGSGNLNEVQVAETSDGGVLLNCRSQSEDRLRFQALSTDGGATFSTAEPVASLHDPICMGSVVRLSMRPNILLFANPNSQKGRTNGTVYASTNDGKSWEQAGVIEPGQFQYNCLCPIGKREFADLYETYGKLPSGGDGYIVMYREFRLESATKSEKK